MSLDRPTCSTIHLLQVDRTLIFSRDMGNIQPNIKKNITQDRKCLQSYTLPLETEAWGNSQMATQNSVFPQIN